MQKDNFIDVSKAVKTINDAFEQQKKVIEETVSHLNTLSVTYNKALPSGYLDALKNSIRLTKEQAKAIKKLEESKQDLLATYERQAKAIKKLEESKQDLLATDEQQAKTQTALNNQQLSQIKLNNAKARSVVKQQTEYRKLQNRIKELTVEYNNLAVLKQRGAQLSKAEEQRLTRLTSLITGYNNVLKKVDADVGKYQRNVGNYARGWDGFNHQVLQLVREIPSMAYGVNVFFGAISNNLPYLFDEIEKVRKENALLLEQGKQAPSVFSRLTSSLFDWQLVLGIGLTLLTLYSRETLNWIKSLIFAKDAVDDLAKAQLAYNKSREQSILSTQKDTNTLEQNLRIAKNTDLSMDVRKEAIKKIRQEYEYHSKALTDNNFLLGETEEFEKKVTKAIEAHNKVIEYQKTIDDNKERVIQLQQELKLRKQFEEDEKRLLNEQNKYSKGSIANRLSQKGISKDEYKTLKFALEISKQELEILREKEKVRIKERKDTDDITLNLKSTSEIQNVINELQDDNLWSQEAINRLREIAIELDIKEEKAKKENTKATYELISAEASLYALKVAYWEREIEENEKIAEDESKGYDVRAKALLKSYEDREVLLQIHNKENIRLAEIQYKEELAKLDKARKDGAYIEGGYQKQLNEINLKYSYERDLIWKKHNDNLLDLQNERNKGLDKEIKKLWEYNRALISVEQVRQNRNRANISSIENNALIGATKRFEEYQESLTDITQDAEEQRLKIEIDSLNKKLSKLILASGLHSKYYSELKELENQLDAIRQKNAEKEAQRLSKLEQDYKKFLNSFESDVLKKFPSIQKFLSDDFQKQFSDLIDNGNIKEAGRLIALQMSEIGQEMYNFMNASSEAYFTREKDRLMTQRDIAIQFAGESATAKDEINRIYDKRMLQLEREQAKRQKKQAIFNATIDLAQGIMSTIADVGFLKAIPMIALLTALGTAQIAQISATPLPAYAEGTLDHVGGAMLVNDGKGSNYRETIITPDGKITRPSGRNVVMNAPKGTMVLNQEQMKAFNSQLGGLLSLNGINSNIQQGITKEDIAELINKTNSNSGVEINVDKNGFKSMIRRNGQRIEKLNSRFSIRNVRR